MVAYGYEFNHSNIGKFNQMWFGYDYNHLFIGYCQLIGYFNQLVHFYSVEAP